MECQHIYTKGDLPSHLGQMGHDEAHFLARVAATKSKKHAEVMVSPVRALQPSYNSLPMSKGDLGLPTSKALSAFGETKRLADYFIEDYRCAGYLDTVYPKQTWRCIALTVEAFEKLGYSLRNAAPSQKLIRVSGATRQQRLAGHFYFGLERNARSN